MYTRKLGRSGIDVSAVGMGCWTIGGAVWMNGKSAGWHSVNDEESIRAIHQALELGVDFFDTADQYGAGYSERMLARAGVTILREPGDTVTWATSVLNETSDRENRQ